MIARITTHQQGHRRILQVDGWLSGDTVATLEELIGAAAADVSVELAGLRSADETALAALRRLRAAGAVLTGVSPYLALLLDATPDDAGSEMAEDRPSPPRKDGPEGSSH